MSHAIIHFDGGARPTNPGPAGFATVVEFPRRSSGQKANEIRVARYIGRHSNNYAEYAGLIVGIKTAIENGASSVEIYGDSKLVVMQVLGDWRCKNDTLKILCREARDLLEKSFPGKWTITHVKREHNSVTDALCTEAILSGRSQNPILKRLGLA